MCMEIMLQCCILLRKDARLRNYPTTTEDLPAGALRPLTLHFELFLAPRATHLVLWLESAKAILVAVHQQGPVL